MHVEFVIHAYTCNAYTHIQAISDTHTIHQEIQLVEKREHNTNRKKAKTIRFLNSISPSIQTYLGHYASVNASPPIKRLMHAVELRAKQGDNEGNGGGYSGVGKGGIVVSGNGDGRRKKAMNRSNVLAASSASLESIASSISSHIEKSQKTMNMQGRRRKKKKGGGGGMNSSTRKKQQRQNQPYSNGGDNTQAHASSTSSSATAVNNRNQVPPLDMARVNSGHPPHMQQDYHINPRQHPSHGHSHSYHQHRHPQQQPYTGPQHRYPHQRQVHSARAAYNRSLPLHPPHAHAHTRTYTHASPNPHTRVRTHVQLPSTGSTYLPQLNEVYDSTFTAYSKE